MTARRRRTSMDASGIRVDPGSSLKLAFLRGRNPTRDLPPCQRAATWCAVCLPGDSSGEPRAGESTLRERQSRACYALSGSERHGPGRTSVEPTELARSMAHAAFSRRTSMRPPASTPDSDVLPGAAFSPTRWLRSKAGTVSCPWSPEGLATTLCTPACSPACVFQASC